MSSEGRGAQPEDVREDDSTRPFSVIARRYVREGYPSKAVCTRQDNDKELVHLLRVFGHMPMRPTPGDLAHSQKLLAYKNREMTEHNVKQNMCERVRRLW